MVHFYTQTEFLWCKFNAVLATLWREFGGLWRKYADFWRNQEPWLQMSYLGKIHFTSVAITMWYNTTLQINQKDYNIVVKMIYNLSIDMWFYGSNDNIIVKCHIKDTDMLLWWQNNTIWYITMH